MEQNSEDSMGTKRSAEIHSGEEPELAQCEPPGKRSCFAEYRILQIIYSTYIKIYLEDSKEGARLLRRTQCEVRSLIIHNEIRFFLQTVAPFHKADSA